MIELMACGTPVIVYRRGSVPEIVHQASAVSLCEYIKEAVKAVYKVRQSEPAALS